MPKADKTRTSAPPPNIQPYPTTASSEARQGSIWSDEEDELLRQGRAADLSWPMICKKWFPHKTPNACRKRHERLMEQRRGEDWDTEKLSRLAQEYLNLRKEMWEVLASRVGERWNVVEAKCMETGLKNIQSIARTAQRKAAAGGSGQGASSSSFEDQGTEDQDRNSDSGIGLCSDAEMEAGPPDDLPSHTNTLTNVTAMHNPHPMSSHPIPQHEPLQHFQHHQHQHHQHHQQYQFSRHPVREPPRDHVRTDSYGQPFPQLPLYKPPPPLQRTFGAPMTTSPDTMAPGPFSVQRSGFPSESHNARGGISIQSVLSPAESHRM